ncbi:hypothetical protein [Sphingomonas oryzagri]
MSVVRRIVPLLLLLGAMVGLFGQQAAYALGPAFVKPIMAGQQSSSSMAGMTGMDCDQMMVEAGQPAHHDGGKPCKDMSLACIAAMGCTIPIVLGGAPAPILGKPLLAPVTFWSTTPRFVGRSYGPEPEPPARLS